MPLRITFVVARFDLSGGSRIIATYAKMMAEHGHRVTVVAPVWRPAPLRKRIRSLLSGGHWDPDHGRPSHFHPQPGVGSCEGVLVQGHEVFDEQRIERVRATYRMPFLKIVVWGWLQRIMAQEYGDACAVLVSNAVDHGVFDAPPRGKQAVPTVGFMYHHAELKGVAVIVAAIQLGDAQALADSALACLQLDDPAWRAMSDRAYATARSHDWSRACEMFAAALEAAHRRAARVGT